MNDLPVILGIGGALALGAISPGPSFLLVARTAVTASRVDGLAAALGMGVGGTLLSGAALLGLHALLTAVPWMYLVLKVLGGAYLLYLGVRIWRGAAEALPLSAGPLRAGGTVLRSFGVGLATQMSNPKTAIVYASVFTAFLPPHLTLWLGMVLALLVFAIETSWYAVVALALSAAAPRACYLRYKRWIDRAAGAVMATLGARLLLSVRAI
jgi:threonine/homoserine/homoserine lactone efflux protein